MPSLDVSSVLAGVAVSDMDQAVAWYTAFLGRGPDALPMPPLADWHFSGGYTLQIVLDVERAGGSTVTLNVADIQAAAANLASRKMTVEVDDTTSDKVKLATVTDPDGNSVTLVESKDHSETNAAG